MKIQNDESIKQVSSFVKNAVEKDTQTKKLNEVKSQGDQVQLSPRAKELQRIKDVLETVPEERADRVAEISDAVQNGNYKSDPQKTAEKLIEESLIDLLL